MLKITNSVAKDIKLILRSKESGLIVILGPLFIVLLVSLAFNTSGVNDIRVATYSQSYSGLAESIITALQENQFLVEKIETEEDCIRRVKSTESHICITFPGNLEIQNNISSEITFHVDPSRLNLVYLVIDKISSKVTLRSSQISKQLTQELLDQLENSRIEIIQRKTDISKLSSSQKESETLLDQISSGVSSINIDFDKSSLQLTDIENKSKILKDTYPNSTAPELYDLIQGLNPKISSLESSINTVITSKNSVTDKVSTLKSSISAEATPIKNIDDSFSKITSGIESIKITEAETIVSPIKPVIKPITQHKKNLNFLFPTLVSLIIMLISLLLATTIVTREKNTKAFFRNFITPTSDISFLIATYITILLIVVLQLIIVFGIASYFLKSEIGPIILNTSLALFILSSVFIFFGMAIGYLFKSEETAVLASISIASFSLFFSNTILPIETIPESLRNLALFNPFVIGDSLLKKLILFQSTIPAEANLIYMLISYLLIFFVLAFATREITKRRA